MCGRRGSIIPILQTEGMEAGRSYQNRHGMQGSAESQAPLLSLISGLVFFQIWSGASCQSRQPSLCSQIPEVVRIWVYSPGFPNILAIFIELVWKELPPSSLVYFLPDLSCRFSGSSLGQGIALVFLTSWFTHSAHAPSFAAREVRLTSRLSTLAIINLHFRSYSLPESPSGACTKREGSKGTAPPIISRGPHSSSGP